MMGGQHIPHDNIVAKLGEGGRGVVSKAYDTKLRRHGDLKFLPVFVSPDSEESARFLHEVHAGRRLIPEVLKYAIQIADGLRYAREHEADHRDITSENMMIAEDGPVNITATKWSRLHPRPGDRFSLKQSF